jgi:hypothetical protein
MANYQVLPPKEVFPRAEAAARDAAGMVDWFFIAGVYTALGDREQAFAWLEKAYENRDFFMTYLTVYPFLDTLHSEPRFVRLQERVGLPKGS